MHILPNNIVVLNVFFIIEAMLLHATTTSFHVVYMHLRTTEPTRGKHAANEVGHRNMQCENAN